MGQDAGHRRSVHSHHNLPLLPPPTNDERDPLRWPRWLKLMALVSTSLFNFTANFAGAGLSVATPILIQEFRKTENQVHNVLTWNFLLLGVGNLFWVPLAVKSGKRAVFLVSTLLLVAVLIWTPKITSFNELVAARCVSGFASASGESLVPSIVSDLFFLHERAATMSIYTVLISSATAIGPLVAAFIVEYDPSTWRTFAWVCVGLAGFNLVTIFLFYPDSTFDRPPMPLVQVPERASDSEKSASEVRQSENILITTSTTTALSLAPVYTVNHVSRPLTGVWTSFFAINRDASFMRAFLQPIRMLAHPSVPWALFMYGASLASQIIITYQFPTFFLAPPYLYKSTFVGLIQIAAIIGFVLGALTGGLLADVITARVILRNRGNVYPEQRLLSLIPFCWVPPAGCIIIAIACSQKLSWVAVAFGYGMVSFGTVFGPNIAITYVVESYPHVASECLVIINVVKNMVAFLFLYVAVEWINSQGWVQVYMIMFMLVTLSMVLAIPFWLHGRRQYAE